MHFLIIWIVCGLLGLAISANKKAGDKTITPGDIIGCLLFGPFLMLIAIVMPHEAVYDAEQTNKLVAGDADGFNKDHFEVLRALHEHGSYNPATDKPIVWDKYRTQRVLADLAAMPESLVNCQEGTYSLSDKGRELLGMTAFIEHLRRGGSPDSFVL
jgi:hypothetical protein